MSLFDIKVLLPGLPGSALCPGVCRAEEVDFSPHQVLTGEKQTQNTPRACLSEMGSCCSIAAFNSSVGTSWV